MEALPVFEQLTIQSHKGPYTVEFNDRFLLEAEDLPGAGNHFLIDANVARLYAPELATVLSHPNTIVIEANEENKSIEKIVPVIERLVHNKIRRDQTLIAVGGGVIQDITCFIASTLLRGLKWKFFPTTLLAQADSCIGSKSSVNLGATKNILGTFYPPKQISINTAFLETLTRKEIQSGLGEIIKVHAIDGVAAFDRLASDFQRLDTDRLALMKYVRAALLVKQHFIEEDEFDLGVRNIFNYGHSFGHAIESATQYNVPHGIAVTMGMEIANSVAVQRGLLPDAHYLRMHKVLRQNYAAHAKTTVPTEEMLSALMKDKKNTTTMLVLVLPVGEDAKIQRVQVAPDGVFRTQCVQAIKALGA